jgi:hypothetical protein
MEIGLFGYTMFAMAGAGALAMAFFFYKAITVDMPNTHTLLEERVQRQRELNRGRVKCAACVHRATPECGYYPLDVPDAGVCADFVKSESPAPTPVRKGRTVVSLL